MLQFIRVNMGTHIESEQHHNGESDKRVKEIEVETKLLCNCYCGEYKRSQTQIQIQTHILTNGHCASSNRALIQIDQ